jgi:hypothetical protein
MRWLVAVCLLVYGATALAQQEVVVVANVQEGTLALQRHEVRNLYMASSPMSDMTPVALPPSDPTRVLFNTKVIGLTEARVQSFWAQMRFSGRGRAPVELPDTQAMIEYLLAHVGAVGYLPSDQQIPEGLVVIYRSG